MKKMLLLITMFPVVLNAAESTVVLSVPHMNCQICPITVKKSLERVDGVSDVQVLLADKEVVVKFDDEQTNIAALKDATAKYGYPSIEKK